MVDERWVEVTPSQFAHERDGLRIVRSLMPEAVPYRAWTNFEFRDENGTWSEIDLLLLTPGGLHLVELKYYSGRLRGTDQTWIRDGHVPEDSPLLLANRKAKRLRSKLMRAYTDWVRANKQRDAPPARQVVPYITADVFLHHPELVCDLPESASWGLYGLPGNEQRSHLPSVEDLFDVTPGPDPIHGQAIARIMSMIGVRAGHREAGSYVLDREPFEDGPGWQDWLGTHKLMRNQRRRIRFQLVPEGSPAEVQRRARPAGGPRAATLGRLHHDGLVRPGTSSTASSARARLSVRPAWQRLDLWLAAQTGFPWRDPAVDHPSDRRGLQYAHAKNVVHRRWGRTPCWCAARATTTQGSRRRLAGGRTTATKRAGGVPATRGITQLASPTALAPALRPVAHRGLHGPRGPSQPRGRPRAARRLRPRRPGLLPAHEPAGRPGPAGTRARLREQEGLDAGHRAAAGLSALRPSSGAPPTRCRRQRPVPTWRPSSPASTPPSATSTPTRRPTSTRSRPAPAPSSTAASGSSAGWARAPRPSGCSSPTSRSTARSRAGAQGGPRRRVRGRGSPTRQRSCGR